MSSPDARGFLRVVDDVSKVGRKALVGVLLWVSACTCQPSKLNGLEPARLTASPASLLFPATHVGRHLRLATQIVNSGGANASVELSVPAPFELQASRLELPGGQSQTVAIDFAPTTAGHFLGTLKIGSLELPIQGEGLAVPVCEAAPVCSQSAFDFVTQQCAETAGPDGVSCESRCVTGSCSGGACRGQLKPCEDSDLCTVDSCSEAEGCSHTPLRCPAPSDPCKIANCNSTAGCSVEDTPDGTLCGPDDCARTQVEVCIRAKCVLRTRPTTGCANTWEPLSLPSRVAAGIAFDIGRQRAVLFGGLNTAGPPRADTWEWDGSNWTQRTTVTAPPARWSPAMVYDAARQRVVLFGGFDANHGVLSDTWEWDGASWTQLTPVASPPARAASAMIYDRARQRVLLFGGDANSRVLSDTWEWDGTRWVARTPATSPPGRGGHAMAYDAVLNRTVLFGGQASGSAYVGGTWLWDGTTWTQQTPPVSPLLRTRHAMAWDAVRKRVVLFGGIVRAGGLDRTAAETWEWDGTTWALRVPTRSAPGRNAQAMVYDETRQQILIVGGVDDVALFSDTWVFDGATWIDKSASAPSARAGAALAYDAARQRVVLFGGKDQTFQRDTWEWDGATWLKRTPAISPPVRFGAAMAYDFARQRIVLFGGSNFQHTLRDTWEWDGVTWTERLPTSPPPPLTWLSLAYDAARQKSVLFGVGSAAETWEWDGATWAQRNAAGPSASTDYSSAYDSDRQRVVLLGAYRSDPLHSDTWEWDGIGWFERASATSPGKRGLVALAYDPVRKRTVLFGGIEYRVEDSVFLTDTMEWDGTAWTTRALAVAPSQTGAVSMTWDDARKEIFLINSAGHSTETWRLRP